MRKTIADIEREYEGLKFSDLRPITINDLREAEARKVAKAARKHGLKEIAPYIFYGKVTRK